MGGDGETFNLGLCFVFVMYVYGTGGREHYGSGGPAAARYIADLEALRANAQPYLRALVSDTILTIQIKVSSVQFG